jgi:REP element-mobilizing transposase RayT
MHLNAPGTLVRNVILQIPDRYPELTLDTFCVMPDHVHLLAMIDAPSDSGPRSSPEDFENWRKERRKMLLARMVGYLKMNSAKRINTWLGTPGTAVWQERYYDQVIRDHEYLRRVREYIMNNARHHQK